MAWAERWSRSDQSPGSYRPVMALTEKWPPSRGLALIIILIQISVFCYSYLLHQQSLLLANKAFKNCRGRVDIKGGIKASEKKLSMQIASHSNCYAPSNNSFLQKKLIET